MLLFAAILCTASSFAQKLPCTIADLNATLKEVDKSVTNSSQYLLMDIDADGVKDIVFRDNDQPSAGYAILLMKKGKPLVDDYGRDGYDLLGYAKGGYSFHQHDDHMGPSGRTWITYFTRYVKGKSVMNGGYIETSVYDETADNMESDWSGSINEKDVTYEEWAKRVPNPTWFLNIKDGWRMVKNNQLYTSYSKEQYDIYDGEIGSYPVILCFNKNKHEGFYFYKARPEGKFTLKCINSKDLGDGNVELTIKEYLPDGTNTGTFTGKYRKGSSFKGTFTNSEEKSFDFSLYWKM